MHHVSLSIVLVLSVLVSIQSAASYKRVCYVSRTSFMPMVVIPPDLCTHVIFGFAKINESGSLVPVDSTDEQIYKELVSMTTKNHELRVLVSIQKGFDNILTANATVKNSFCKSVVNFLNKYGFDGVDLDWEPVSFPLKPSQISGYADLLRLLDKWLHGDDRNGGYLMSAALYASKPKASVMYNMRLLAQVMQFVTVMTYDYHLFIFEKGIVTGHNSPLYPEVTDPPYWSINGTLYFYLVSGMPISKIIMGFPTYGRSYKLKNPEEFGIAVPAVGPGDPGPIRKLRGVYSYQDVCTATQYGTMTTWDDRSQVPYYHNGTTWLSFDNLRSISAKCSYLTKYGFGGVGIWALHMDDFSNVCKQGPFPLITAWKQCLQG